MLLEITNKVDFGYNDIAEAFPDADPGVEPLGSRVLCQMRTARKKTKGGIILTEEARETNQWNTQVAKVVAIGALAFCNRNTQEQWTEGAWAKPGDFVRVPKYGGDRWSVTIDEGGEKVEILFVIFNDLDLIGKIADPLAIRAYI